MRCVRQGLFVIATAVSISAAPASADTFYVANGGSNGDTGGTGDPWETLSYALSQINGGDVILVRDGLYEARSSTSRLFSDWVTLRSENPYGAKLTNVSAGDSALVVSSQGSAKIVIDGFVISNAHPTYVCGAREANYLVHFQDANDVTFRNNIVFGNNAPGTCNEVLKINRGGDPYYPKGIVIQGNVFYDHASADGSDIIDAVRPGEVDILENIFFTRSTPSGQSFITLKRQVDAASLGITPRSPRYRIARNIFFNYDGKADQAFIQLGEDSYAEVMISDALIENNLIIGNSANSMAAPFQFKGVRNITVRANTVVGDLPSGAFGFRIGTEVDNLQVRDIHIANNIFADPTGSMGNRLINTYGDIDIATITLDNNLYWNNGNALPTTETPAPQDDASRVELDPALEADQSNVTLPVWNEGLAQFASGTTSIRREFERLALAYGALGTGSAAVGAADPAQMPTDDLLGFARDAQPDIGSLEKRAALADGGPTTDGGPITDGGPTDGDTAGDETSGGDTKIVGLESGCGCSGSNHSLAWVLVAAVSLLRRRLT